jgi:hypothetical protein
MCTSDYKWDDYTKTDSKLSLYFDGLIGISTLAHITHDKWKTAHKRADSKTLKIYKNNAFKGQIK